MRETGRNLVLWGPRVLGLLVAILAAALATDAIGEGTGALLMHLLPAFVLLAAVAVGWRHPLVGGLAFLALAALYAATTAARPDWILTVALPLLVVGVLFVWSWRHRRLAAPRA